MGFIRYCFMLFFKSDEVRKYRHIIGKASVTTLEPGKGMKDFDEDNNILGRVTGIVIL